MPALHARYTHYSWVGWSNNVSKFLTQGSQLLVLPHIPQIYSWVDWSNVGKVLAQGNNNKQHHLGIEPGSQANPKPLHAAAPRSFKISKSTCISSSGLPPSLPAVRPTSSGRIGSIFLTIQNIDLLTQICCSD